MTDLVEETSIIVIDPITYINNGHVIELKEDSSQLSKFEWAYDGVKAHQTLSNLRQVLKEEADEQIMRLYS